MTARTTTTTTSAATTALQLSTEQDGLVKETIRQGRIETTVPPRIGDDVTIQLRLTTGAVVLFDNITPARPAKGGKNAALLPLDGARSPASKGLEAGKSAPSTLTFTIGQGQVCKALDLTVATMFPGEVCRIKFKEYYAKPTAWAAHSQSAKASKEATSGRKGEGYANSVGEAAMEGSRSAVPITAETTEDEATYQCLIKLLRTKRMGDVGCKFQRGERVARCRTVKEKAATLVKEGYVDHAISAYNYCTKYLQIDVGDEEVDKFMSIIYTNLAVCYRKKGDIEKSFQAACKGIDFDKTNVKAAYHKSNCLIDKGAYQEAINLCSIGLAIDSENRVLRKLHKTAVSKLSKERRKEKDMYKRMMSSSAEEPSHGNESES